MSNDRSDSLREKGRASHPRFCNDNDENRGRGCLRILPRQRQLLLREGSRVMGDRTPLVYRELLRQRSTGCEIIQVDPSCSRRNRFAI
jgi:hypothetical protein